MNQILVPFAEHKLIAPDANDPRIVIRIGILHVDAGNSDDLHDLFVRNQRPGASKIEAHCHIRKDGHMFQYRDLRFQADANKDANDFAWSIETQGFGEGEWTARQLATIKRSMLWARDELGIPLRTVTTWNDPKGGWGYHTLFGAPSHWTPIAKSCPGPDRKVQYRKVLEPWMKEQNRMAASKPNKVEQYRAAAEKGIAATAKAAERYPIPPGRPAAHAMQLNIESLRMQQVEALKEGPSK